VLVPDIGGFKDVSVIDVLVKDGQQIDKETPMITIETEKAAMDVPSPAAGRITEVKLRKGDKVSEGSVILLLEDGGEAQEPPVPPTQAEGAARQGGAAKEGGAAREGGAAKAGAPNDAGEANRAGEAKGVGTANPAGAAERAGVARDAGETANGGASKGAGPAAIAGAASGPARADLDTATGVQPTGISHPATNIDEAAFSKAYASPSVRKFARELGADLGKISGSGPKARITHEDVKAFVKMLLTSGAGAAAGAAVGSMPKVPEVDFAKFGAIEVQPLSRIQRISGARLQASWVNVPHVTQNEEADITDLDIARVALKGKAEAEGVRLTPLAFVVKACVAALKEFPRFNASLDSSGQNLVLKKYFHIGFAADTPNGLVVPVIRDADRGNLFDIARALAELSEKARAGKLKAAEMQGGSFTISSLGGIGGTSFTPIINAPEVAILGVSKSSQKPVFDKGAFIPRLMLPLSLSYDHRVIDGAEAARFVVFLSKTLSDVKALL
jgi:pyruvate dehydrogenase E2 component (dihydrolipoamide acetyltransferase)